MNELRNKSFETLAIRLGTQAFSVAASILLARMLGTYGKGVMTYVVTVSSLLQTVWSGQSVAISWQYGRQKTPARAVARAMLRILLFGGLPISLLVLAVALTVPSQRHLSAVAASLPFVFFSILAVGFFLADGNVRISNMQALITQVGFCFALFAILLVFHLGLNAVLIAWVAMFVVSAAYTAVQFRRYLAASGDSPTDNFIASQVLFGLRASINAVVWVLNSRIDVFIILYFLGVRPLGVYSVGLGLGESMWQLSSALVTSAFGRITTAARSEAAELTAKCVRHALAMVLSVAVVLYCVGPTLVVWVYGPAFAEAGPVLRVLLPGMIAYSMMPFLTTFFTQQLGRPGISSLIGAASIVVCAVITIATIRQLGIVAGALGTSLSYSIAFLVAAQIFSRRTGLPMSALFLFTAEDRREYGQLVRALSRPFRRLPSEIPPK